MGCHSEKPQAQGPLLANGQLPVILYSLLVLGCGGWAAYPWTRLLPQTWPVPTETPTESQALQSIMPWALRGKHSIWIQVCKNSFFCQPIVPTQEAFVHLRGQGSSPSGQRWCMMTLTPDLPRSQIARWLGSSFD